MSAELPEGPATDAANVDEFKPYADAGHDIESLFNPNSYRCSRCHSWLIDLSEDLAYGEMRRCAEPKP